MNPRDAHSKSVELIAYGSAKEEAHVKHHTDWV